MSEGRNRIDALLNGPSNGHGDASPTTGVGAVGLTDSYTVPPGQNAPQNELPADSDAQIFVDGHEVAAGGPGTDVDVAPNGSAKVTEPADGQNIGGPGGHDTGGHHGGHGQHGQHGQHGHDGNGHGHDGRHGGHGHGHGDGSKDHGPGGGDHPKDGEPGHEHLQHVKGEGKNPAEADLDVHGFGKHPPQITTTKNPDGSLDILIHKGPHNPHDVRVHVPPGKDVQVDVSPGKNGHLNVKLEKPKSHDGKPGDGKPGDGKPGDGKGGGAGDGKNGGKDGKGGAPKAPKGPGGGGGAPKGGGGGGPNGGGGGGVKQPGKKNGNGQRNGDWAAIRKLGEDIDKQAGGSMDDAHQKASGIDVSWPAFGVLGFPLNMAHTSVRNQAATYLKDGRSMLQTWRRQLDTNASTWEEGEQASTLPGYGP